MRIVKGTRKGNKIAVSISFSHVNFCFFKSISEQYKIPFGKVVNMFLTETVEIEKEMAMDGDIGFEYNIKKKRGMI